MHYIVFIRFEIQFRCLHENHLKGTTALFLETFFYNFMYIYILYFFVLL